jgi:hypothetical protein
MIEQSFKTFRAWAGVHGYDTAYAHDGIEWVCLNPMTNDLWKAWRASVVLSEKPISQQDAEALRKLGWKAIECSVCGGGAQAFQSVKKPMSDYEAQDIVERESWGPDAISLNASLLRTIRRTEAKHGIKESLVKEAGNDGL